jgi:hypothetical protein
VARIWVVDIVVPTVILILVSNISTVVGTVGTVTMVTRRVLVVRSVRRRVVIRLMGVIVGVMGFRHVYVMVVVVVFERQIPGVVWFVVETV